MIALGSFKFFFFRRSFLGFVLQLFLKQLLRQNLFFPQKPSNLLPSLPTPLLLLPSPPKCLELLSCPLSNPFGFFQVSTELFGMVSLKPKKALFFFLFFFFLFSFLSYSFSLSSSPLLLFSFFFSFESMDRRSPPPPPPFSPFFFTKRRKFTQAPVPSLFLPLPPFFLG